MKIKGDNTKTSSSLIFAVTFATLFLGFTLSINFGPQINDPINSNIAMAQQTVATLASSTSDDTNNSNTMIFNKYENNEVGISIKYPSNFLIDESNSNETVKQVSFFPAYDDSSDYPSTYISWFNVYVEELYPPISENPINISTYLKDEANAIQEQNSDVTILETSTDYMLSGENAYKLVTRSYSGNSTIDDVEVGTIVGNKLYILNYEVDSQDAENALPIANRMIYSFEINSNNLANTIQQMVNSTNLDTIKQKVPVLEGILSSLNLKNLTENPYGLLNNLGLDNSTKNTIEGFLMNSTQNNNGTAQANFSSLIKNGLSGLSPQKLCTNELLSSLCQGGLFSHSPMTPFSDNDSSFGGLNNLLAMSSGNSTSNGFNLSNLKNLLGPFAMLTAPSSSESFFSNDSGLESMFNTATNESNSDSLFLNQLFSGGNGGLFNETKESNESSNNPFESLFRANETGLNMFGADNNNNVSNSSMNSIFKDNGTMDILRMLKFFQGGQ